jgi:RNA polymerase sigma factor (sigma-70 family)
VTQAERLTPKQERDLVIAAERGDVLARRRLVETFMPSIAALARQFSAGRVDRQDLLQEGVAALLFAARRYDSRRGTPFWAYASFWVRKSMQELVADLARPVALSDRAVRELAQVKRARAAHAQAHGAEPTIDELSRATGFTPAQVDNLLATERLPRGIEEPAGVDGDATFGDGIADPTAELDYEHVLDDIEFGEVEDLTVQLDEREREVLRAHYGLGQPAQTLGEIGSSLGVSSERARQLEAHALKTLRDALALPAPRLTGTTK